MFTLVSEKLYFLLPCHLRSTTLLHHNTTLLISLLNYLRFLIPQNRHTALRPGGYRPHWRLREALLLLVFHCFLLMAISQHLSLLFLHVIYLFLIRSFHPNDYSLSLKRSKSGSRGTVMIARTNTQSVLFMLIYLHARPRSAPHHSFSLLFNPRLFHFSPFSSNLKVLSFTSRLSLICPYRMTGFRSKANVSLCHTNRITACVVGFYVQADVAFNLNT